MYQLPAGRWLRPISGSTAYSLVSELVNQLNLCSGVQHAGHTAYVEVDLSPGRYAWVLGNPLKQGSVQPFPVE